MNPTYYILLYTLQIIPIRSCNENISELYLEYCLNLALQVHVFCRERAFGSSPSELINSKNRKFTTFVQKLSWYSSCMFINIFCDKIASGKSRTCTTKLAFLKPHVFCHSVARFVLDCTLLNNSARSANLSTPSPSKSYFTYLLQIIIFERFNWARNTISHRPSNIIISHNLYSTPVDNMENLIVFALKLDADGMVISNRNIFRSKTIKKSVKTYKLYL